MAPETEFTKHSPLTWLMATRKRFLMLPLGITAFRALIAIILYSTLRVGGVFSVPFMDIWEPKLPFDWLYLFSAWDSIFYRGIALYWYPTKPTALWAFLPLYPATVKLIALSGIDTELGALIISIICSLASIVVFQQIAERYMDKTQALIATTMYFLFPPVFVFSAATYPESMFLLFTLVSWRLHQEKSDLRASVAAALSSLIRWEGFFLVIPLLYDFTRQKQFKKITYLLIPLAAIAGWEVYGFVITGFWLPTLAAYRFWSTAQSRAVALAVRQLIEGNRSSIAILLPYSWLIAAILASLVAVVFLAWRVWRIDKALCIYVLTSVFILAVTTRVAYRSFPRVLGFFFPIGLAMHTRKTKLLIVVIILFLVVDYFAWLAFLTDGFY